MGVGASLRQQTLKADAPANRQNGMMLFFRKLKNSISASRAASKADKCISENNLQEALELYDKAILLQPLAGFYYGRGLLNSKMKNHGKAIEDFNSAIKAGMSGYYIHYLLAREHISLHEYEHALVDELHAYGQGKNDEATMLAISRLYSICGKQCLRNGNGSAALSAEYFDEAEKWKTKSEQYKEPGWQ